MTEMLVFGCLRWWALARDAAASWLSFCHGLLSGGATAEERERVILWAEEKMGRREKREKSTKRRCIENLVMEIQCVEMRRRR